MAIRASASGQIDALIANLSSLRPVVRETALARLTDGNRAYQERFGYIFIVCATGKSADEMLGLLESRIGNAPEAEIVIAAEEQMKITRLRLEKLLAEDR